MVVALMKMSSRETAHWRIEEGGGKGTLPHPPKRLRCSKLEVADQQGVINSRL